MHRCWRSWFPPAFPQKGSDLGGPQFYSGGHQRHRVLALSYSTADRQRWSTPGSRLQGAEWAGQSRPGTLASFNGGPRGLLIHVQVKNKRRPEVVRLMALTYCDQQRRPVILGEDKLLSCQRLPGPWPLIYWGPTEAARLLALILARACSCRSARPAESDRFPCTCHTG